MSSPTWADLAREWGELPSSYRGAVIVAIAGLCFALVGAGMVWGIGASIMGLGLAILIAAVGFMQQ